MKIPVVAIDRSSGAFLGSDGRRYYEVEADVFVLDGIVEEGVIACHGFGRTEGTSCSKPFYERRDGAWVNMYSGAVARGRIARNEGTIC